MTTGRLLLELPTEIKREIISNINMFDIEFNPEQLEKDVNKLPFEKFTELRTEQKIKLWRNPLLLPRYYDRNDVFNEMSGKFPYMLIVFMMLYSGVRKQTSQIAKISGTCNEFNSILYTFFNRNIDETKFSMLILLMKAGVSIEGAVWRKNEMCGLISANPYLLFQSRSGFVYSSGYGSFKTTDCIFFRGFKPYQLSILLKLDSELFDNYLAKDERDVQLMELKNILENQNDRESIQIKIRSKQTVYWWEEDIDKFINEFTQSEKYRISKLK